MKKQICLLLALTMLLCGCGGRQQTPETTQPQTQPTAAQPTTAPTTAPTEPTTEPTTAPTEPPIPRNPLNGQILDEPFTGRLYANTVSNLQENLPHVGVVDADIVMEMYASMNNVVRCLALFSDIESVEAIGSTRSTRPIFNDIAQHYDLILTHAGGSSTAINDANNRGLDHFNLDSWKVSDAGASYRDTEYKRPYENTLFGVGAGIKAYAEAAGCDMTLERDYGFRFTEDGTPAEGEIADKVTINMIYQRAKKETVMLYDAALDKYVWNQYGKEMTDQITSQREAFTNVIVMQAVITNEGIYHAADFVAGGVGYYANGGRLIPIVWTCQDEDSAFEFMTTDARPLELGVGNTYICIVSMDSQITWEEVIPPETVPPTEETVPETTAQTLPEDAGQTPDETVPQTTEQTGPTMPETMPQEDCLG